MLFSILKVLTIIMFIIRGILVNAGVLGCHKYGMDAWHAPFNNDLLSFVKPLVSVGYAYGGTELSGVSAAEFRNPTSMFLKLSTLPWFASLSSTSSQSSYLLPLPPIMTLC
ncbi:hypothetical protein BGX27_006595 [Mortierella sp. AM989]|nr:hypothetical protein BGX27_006595 [Mortierella sp. AM989]